MAWERIGERRYYYRYQWQDGRCVRVYVGTGAAAELAAAIDDLARVQQQIAARALQEERERLTAAAAPLQQLCDASEVLSQAALLAAGYHQHARSQWRRRRRGNTQPNGCKGQ
jgi:hypothetical protein